MSHGQILAIVAPPPGPRGLIGLPEEWGTFPVPSGTSTCKKPHQNISKTSRKIGLCSTFVFSPLCFYPLIKVKMLRKSDEVNVKKRLE
jgi:nitrate reductase NapE component